MAFNRRVITKELDMANLAKHNDNYADIKTELDSHDAHVASQTAHGSTSAATAGKIMQRDASGRAKVAAPVATDDIARKAEVDAVQTNLNTHKADAVAHLSEEDRIKFDGIEDGAEPNQNAFTQVNDVVAAAESDTLTIEGGTGITISTNPTTKKVIVTATGEATPGAHGSSHNVDGADPIPDLVTLRSDFDALTPADIGAETPDGAQAKVDALAGVGNTKTVAEVSVEVEDLSKQLIDMNEDVYNLSGPGGFPKFTKYANNPIVFGNTQTQNQAGFVSVICMDGIISNPIDKFYMYWAGHDGGGIWLSTAPHPLGPWTTYGQVITDSSMYSSPTEYNNTPGAHISSPEVIFVPDLNVLRMYFHRAYQGQFTEYCHSTDGLTWTKQPGRITTPAQDGSWNESELSYFRVCRVNEIYYATYQGRDRRANAKGLGFGVSSDGITFKWSDMPLFYNTQFKDGYTPQSELGGAPCLINLKGQLWVFFGDGNTNRVIKASPLNDPFERDPLVKTMLPSTETWEGGNVESPNFLYHSGYLYMYYNGQNQLKERSVGVAFYKLGG